jgi:hypothetical protein
MWAVLSSDQSRGLWLSDCRQVRGWPGRSKHRCHRSQTHFPRAKKQRILGGGSGGEGGEGVVGGGEGGDGKWRTRSYKGARETIGQVVGN